MRRWLWMLLLCAGCGTIDFPLPDIPVMPPKPPAPAPTNAAPPVVTPPVTNAPPVQPPVTNLPPANPPAATNSATLQPASVKWLSSRGPNYAKAKTVLTLTDVSIKGSRCYFKTASPIPWPKSGSKGVNAIGILIRRIGAQYVGGKCEWCVGSRGWYDIRTNTAGGYNGHTLPSPGETVWVGLGNPDNGNQVSTLVPARWP